MKHYRRKLTDDATERLKTLVNRPLSWVFGDHLLLLGEQVISPYLSLRYDQGYLVFRAEHFESPAEHIDFYGLEAKQSSFVDGCSLDLVTLMETVSAVQTRLSSPPDEIVVYTTTRLGEIESATFDSAIGFRLRDGQEFSIGRPPAGFPGIAFRHTAPHAELPGDTTECRVSISASGIRKI